MTRSHIIFPIINAPIKHSIRQISKFINISKSSVHRYIKAFRRRNIYAESYFWETQEGYHWLHILVCAVIFVFGIKSGVGAEAISMFFGLLRLDMHIGVSATTIRKLREEMMGFIVEYAKEQEKNQILKSPLKIAAGIDETFFEKMILVFMDVATGFIFFEEEAQDRSYDTWNEKIQHVANKFNRVQIRSFISRP